MRWEMSDGNGEACLIIAVVMTVELESANPIKTVPKKGAVHITPSIHYTLPGVQLGCSEAAIKRLIV